MGLQAAKWSIFLACSHKLKIQFSKSFAAQVFCFFKEGFEGNFPGLLGLKGQIYKKYALIDTIIQSLSHFSAIFLRGAMANFVFLAGGAPEQDYSGLFFFFFHLKNLAVFGV